MNEIPDDQKDDAFSAAMIWLRRFDSKLYSDVDQRHGFLAALIQTARDDFLKGNHSSKWNFPRYVLMIAPNCLKDYNAQISGDPYTKIAYSIKQLQKTNKLIIKDNHTSRYIAKKLYKTFKACTFDDDPDDQRKEGLLRSIRQLIRDRLIECEDININECNNKIYAKIKKITAWKTGASIPTSEFEQPDDHAAESDDRRELKKAIRGLPPNDQLIVLKRATGNTNKQIGDQLGESERTISHRYHQILKTLRGYLVWTINN